MLYEQSALPARMGASNWPGHVRKAVRRTWSVLGGQFLSFEEPREETKYRRLQQRERGLSAPFLYGKLKIPVQNRSRSRADTSYPISAMG